MATNNSQTQPPFFKWVDPAIIDEWLNVGFRLPMGRSKRIMVIEKELLNAWRELSVSHEPGAIFDLGDIYELMNRLAGKQRSLVAVKSALAPRLRMLSHAGPLWRDRATAQGYKRAYLFTLRSPRDVASNWQGLPSDSQENKETAKPDKRSSANMGKVAEATYRHLVDQGYMARLVESEQDPKESDPWTLLLISQLIERCSRSNSWESADTLEATIRLNGEPVNVEAGRMFHKWENSHEYGLITADDSQLILAILTLAMQNIARDLEAGINPPRNRVTFDLYELSKMLSPGSGRLGYRPYQLSMARIINTEYRLSRATKDGNSTRVRFRLVEDVVEGEESEHVDGDSWVPKSNMRYFSFSLNSHIWKGLLNGDGWLVHPHLLYERQGLVHKLYHHLRTNISADRPYVVTGEELMTRLNISSGTNHSRARTRFCKSLWQLLRERADLSEALLNPNSNTRLTVKLFDLDLVAYPDDSKHKGGLRIEASQSPETLELLERQKRRLRGLREHAGQNVDPLLRQEEDSRALLESHE